MQQGSVADAVALAKQRWAALWPFDLDPATWEQLFTTYRPTDVIEAIKRTRGTRAKLPAAVFQSLLYWLNGLEQERNEKANPIWPPPDVQRN